MFQEQADSHPADKNSWRLLRGPGKENVGEHDLTEACFPDEALVVIGMRRLDIDMHIDVSDRFAPRCVAARRRQIIGREDKVHGFLLPLTMRRLGEFSRPKLLPFGPPNNTARSQ